MFKKRLKKIWLAIPETFNGSLQVFSWITRYLYVKIAMTKLQSSESFLQKFYTNDMFK